MTDEEIREIEARAEKATPGPWCVDWWDRKDQDGHYCHGVDGQTESIFFHVAEWSAYKNDLEFIAHSRSDIPKLIAALRKAKAEIEELKYHYVPVGDL